MLYVRNQKTDEIVAEIMRLEREKLNIYQRSDLSRIEKEVMVQELKRQIDRLQDDKNGIYARVAARYPDKNEDVPSACYSGNMGNWQVKPVKPKRKRNQV